MIEPIESLLLTEELLRQPLSLLVDPSISWLGLPFTTSVDATGEVKDTSGLTPPWVLDLALTIR